MSYLCTQTHNWSIYFHHLQSSDEQEMSAVLQAALQAAVQRQTFPKANLDVYCLILESGGSDAAVAITAASLAIADAGIDMYDLVSACSVVRNRPC